MASIRSSPPPIYATSSLYFSSFSSPNVTVSFPRLPYPDNRRMACQAMVQQAVRGSPATLAQETERVSAKESLLLALKDAGGFEAVVMGRTTEMQRIDVNERITGLERLNPTPRPTTSPFLEGRWNFEWFEWFGSGSRGLFPATFIFERFPSTLANLSRMDVVIKDGNANITVIMKLLSSTRACISSLTLVILGLNVVVYGDWRGKVHLEYYFDKKIESTFILISRLSVEGPLRMREEYFEGVLETPTIIEETVPAQLKGAFGQAVSTVQQLLVPIRDAVSSGLRVPLSGSFQRLFMISYLDDEILIIRDTTGVPEVLSRLDAPISPMVEPYTEYES